MKPFLTIITLAIILIFNTSAFAGRKCCYNHGGVKKCDGTDVHICEDGYQGHCKKHNHFYENLRHIPNTSSNPTHFTRSRTGAKGLFQSINLLRE